MTLRALACRQDGGATRRRRYRQALAAATFAVLFAVRTLAQQPATGFPPFGSFSGGQFDTVNNANLNVHFEIPVFSKAGRGLPFQYALTFDSSVWTPVWSQGSFVWTRDPNWGWRGVAKQGPGYITYDSVQQSCFDSVRNTWVNWDDYTNWVYNDPSGTSHQFPYAATTNYNSSNDHCGNDSNSSSASDTAIDGSGYGISINDVLTATVYSRSGVEINADLLSPLEYGSVIDTNGNTLTVTPADGGITVTDTLGSTPLTVSGTNPVTYTYPTTGASASVVVHYSTYTVQTNFGCSGVVEFGPYTESLVSSISLPDMTSYAFTYEPTPGVSGAVTGRIASVTLPAGGTVSYIYTGGSNGINCNDGSTAGLTRQLTPGGSWTYTRSGSNPAVTTVLDPQGNQAVFDFQGLYETERQIYQGTTTLLRTVYTCYNGASAPCNNTTVPVPVTQQAVTAVLDNNLESETVTEFNARALPTEVDEYGFGQGAIGGLYRKTVTSYASLSNPNVLDRPSLVQVYNSSGGLTAQTSYGYDGNGNLTSLSENVTASSTISRSFTYDSHGVLQSATDFNGNTTTFTNNACNGSFPSSINEPLGLTINLVWDKNSPCNTALVTSVSDLSGGNPTGFQYDEMNRVSEINYPDGGWKLMNYTSANQTDVYTGITDTTPSTTCTGCRLDETVYDGGRLAQLSIRCRRASDQRG